MPVFSLPDDIPVFPSPLLTDPSGVLAVGGDLSPERLLLAYAHGIFPWFSEGQPLMWWFPDPRCVLYPADLHISRSLTRTLNRDLFEVRYNSAFSQVVTACREIDRTEQEGTWITRGMQAAYETLHRMGYAHSVEAWQDGTLAGGLYGIALGRIFFGESMFSQVADASKVALVHLVRMLENSGVWLIDCQQDTPHLRSLGASVIPASDFYQITYRNRLSILKEGDQVLFEGRI